MPFVVEASNRNLDKSLQIPVKVRTLHKTWSLQGLMDILNKLY